MMRSPSAPARTGGAPAWFLLFVLAFASPAAAQDGQPLTFTDLMRIRQVEDPSISADGAWVAFTARPDRGDPEVIVRSADGDARYAVPLASDPVISPDGAWVAARVGPSLVERETAEGDPPNPGMALVETRTGTVTRTPDVEAFAFSGDGAWLAVHLRPAPGEDEGEGSGEEEDAGGSRPSGSPLVLRHLDSGMETRMEGVRAFAFDDGGTRVAWTTVGDEVDETLVAARLADGGLDEILVHAGGSTRHGDLAWSDDGRLAFTTAPEDPEGQAGRATLHVWSEDEGGSERVAADEAPAGWMIPPEADLEWGESGQRLFFGWRPIRADEGERVARLEGLQAAGGAPAGVAPPEDGPFDPYDVGAILEDRGVDVWHWLDPRINPQQKTLWPQEKDRTYRAVHYLDTGTTVALEDPELPEVSVSGDASVALGVSDVPYRREFTWMGGQSDLYAVDVSTGERTRVAERVRGGRSSRSLSPGGRFVVWYDGGAYHLHDLDSGETRNLTAGLGVPFADEDHDYPDPAPGYGIAGWIEDDGAVLIYDKYDLWRIPTDGDDAWRVTDGRGRAENREFRLADLDRDEPAFGDDEAVLLTSYHHDRKHFGFYRARTGRPGVTRLLEEEKRFQAVARAEGADRILYTREDYDEFPDLWVAGPDFSSPRRLTDVNPDLDRFAWGTAELTEWESLDGTPLQGVVIKPGNHEEGRRYPVLVYYYRFFSQRLHEFNEPAVNHRPSFPLYASNGYVVFLPDVRFDVGEPGFSATKSVVPGVQHLIDIGLADPEAVALHGHSWSGYQTAFVVTQTDLFRTAIAGAPVGNMTSAYSGIRWGSGLARQFQYEMGQSRLSGSLWEARDEYIDNSPVFFADRIETPMLILHGDVDDAVPWYQSIELYLALRRNDKETVFLQYRDEPHHPQTYANKLDWAMKMKQWLDHYLKGEPAAEWITEGVPYRGN